MISLFGRHVALAQALPTGLQRAWWIRGWLAPSWLYWYSFNTMGTYWGLVALAKLSRYLMIVRGMFMVFKDMTLILFELTGKEYKWSTTKQTEQNWRNWFTSILKVVELIPNCVSMFTNDVIWIKMGWIAIYHLINSLQHQATPQPHLIPADSCW